MDRGPSLLFGQSDTLQYVALRPLHDLPRDTCHSSFSDDFWGWLCCICNLFKSRFRKFLLLSLGNFILWTMMEDEFTFIFTGSPHTLTDWTNWPIGAVRIFGYYIPDWYVLATASIFLCWFFGLALTEEKQTELATQ